MSSIYPLLAALFANVLAQVLKPVVLYLRTQKVDIHQCIACGGFPSSHSSTVTALTMAIGSVSYTHLTLPTTERV